MKLYSINAGLFKLDGGAMFGVVPKSIWNKLNAADENNMCTWALRCLLIETDDKRILIDTGMGNKQDAKFFGHYYLHGNDTLEGSLAKHGFTKDDITDVFHTHLHFDHCGGTIVRDGEQLSSAFKNATLWSNEPHWSWATKPNDREKASFLKENILPMQESGRLQFAPVEENVSIFNEDITLKFAYGHTDAMMLPIIKYKGRTIVYMADLLPSAAHLPLPYVMSYDMFPLKTLGEKKGFLQEALENDYVLFFEHDANIECCTLKMTDKGIRVKETFELEDL
ncbi:MBL fold metallo-hydrolase [Segetibacter sp.]|jgi:glyoxylase-like metal-dependent hydrolase (beta-lactamase superfamily II)|uniref:MBL fold metallo-hydrolase n=1 Tax=Segetibacter sp. TaxID=2231182 RepID=UPI002633537A|nr:MBL fold metallo-hydrolase [Segetibacter sp.]MCW3079931.1 beta-lactamase domain protein [Segetibacter sp.]